MPSSRKSGYDRGALERGLVSIRNNISSLEAALSQEKGKERQYEILLAAEKLKDDDSH